MKALLEFDLPTDQIEFNRASQSINMACALFDISHLSRKCRKQFDEDKGDILDGIEIMGAKISEIFTEHNINLDELLH